MAVADQKQQFWPTFFAFVTALATLAGAVGGIIATALAVTGGGGAAPTPPPAPTAASSTPSAGAPRPTASTVASPTPWVLELAADADSSWAYPPAPSEDQESLALDWGCSRDSRGNGSKEDCASGVIAVRFDLTALPRGATIEGAALSLYAEEGGSGIDVYARRATTQWKEADSNEPPECDPTGETAGQVDGNEWTWDVTPVLRGQQDAGGTDFGVCLVLKADAGIVFGSREGAPSTAPALTITYR